MRSRMSSACGVVLVGDRLHAPRHQEVDRVAARLQPDGDDPVLCLLGGGAIPRRFQCGEEIVELLGTAGLRRPVHRQQPAGRRPPMQAARRPRQATGRRKPRQRSSWKKDRAGQRGPSKPAAKDGWQGGRAALALARFEAAVGLVDDVDAPLAPHEAVAAMAGAKRSQGITDFHRGWPAHLMNETSAEIRALSNCGRKIWRRGQQVKQGLAGRQVP